MLSSLSSTIMTVLDIPRPSDSPTRPSQGPNGTAGCTPAAFTQALGSITSADVLRKRKHEAINRPPIAPPQATKFEWIQELADVSCDTDIASLGADRIRGRAAPPARVHIDQAGVTSMVRRLSA